MPKKPDPRIEMAKELYLQGTKLVEIASQLELPEGTVRRWKCTHKWDSERSDKNQANVRKKRGGQPGNHNATGPPGNQHAVKHGFFCKVLPAETLELVEDLGTLNPLDVLWQNIQIQYAAILRAQQIMFVKDRDDKTKERIEVKDGNVIGERWEVQQAWDKQATFLAAQSRAMQTLTNMIKQYDAMVDSGLANQEQRARIELLRAQVNKLTGDDEDGGIQVMFKKASEMDEKN